MPACGWARQMSELCKTIKYLRDEIGAMAANALKRNVGINVSALQKGRRPGITSLIRIRRINVAFAIGPGCVEPRPSRIAIKSLWDSDKGGESVKCVCDGMSATDENKTSRFG